MVLTYKMRRFIMIWMITGGTGKLGTEVERLLRLSRPEDVVYTPTRAVMDITNPSSVRAAVLDVRPDVVVNCAAWTDVDGAETNILRARSLNALGPEVLAETLSKLSKGTLVHISTDYVFNGLGPQPYREDSEVSPQGVYACTKAEGEELVRSALGERSLVVRTSWLYSSQSRNFARSILRQLYDGAPLSVVCDQFGHPTWTQDVSQRILLLVHALFMGQLPSGTYHAVNSGVTSWWGFAQELARLGGFDPSSITPIGSSELKRPAPRPCRVELTDLASSRHGLPAMRPWNLALKAALPTIPIP